MHVRNLLAMVLTASIAYASVAARADTVADILGAEKSINDLARRAQETGDHLAEAFASQALRVIEEWKKANAELVKQVSSAVDKETAEMFRQLNAAATRLEKGEAVGFIDLQRAMATAGDVLSRIPGGDGTPQVAFSWPTILLPTGESTITFHVVGTRIAESKPEVTLSGESIAVKRVGDNEISFDVARSKMPVDEKQRTQSTFSLDYKNSTSHWYNPFSWGSSETRHRDLVVSMLPKVAGTVVATPTITIKAWDYMRDGPHLVGGRGKDATYQTGYSLTPLQLQQGWQVDIEAQGQHPTDFNDNGGDGDGGSSCSGFDAHRINANFVGFNIQHGHKGSFKKSDAHQNCNIWVYLKKPKNEEKTADLIAKPLGWQEDVDLAFPAETTSYAVAVSLYTGRRYTIDSSKKLPYDLYEMFWEPKQLKLRPRPQRDF
jgi:hypothetical protein